MYIISTGKFNRFLIFFAEKIAGKDLFNIAPATIAHKWELLSMVEFIWNDYSCNHNKHANKPLLCLPKDL